MSLLKKNDVVTVIAGKDRGKKGKILSVFPKEGTVLVEGVNMARKHMRRKSAENPKGGIVTLEKPLYVSKVQYFCNRCNRPVRLGMKAAPDGGFVRICRHCKEEL